MAYPEAPWAGFRLDIEGDDIDDAALAALSTKDLRLLVVGKVTILNKQIMHERHNRPRQAPTATDVEDLSISATQSRTTG
jgi:hypothetical protein